MSGTSDETPRISFERVTCLFGKRAAVRDLSLDVRAGEILCLLGPSGCGKTTTLRLAAGLERPDTGTIRIDGQVVAGNGRFVPPELRSAGLMFQDFALFPHLSVAQNIAFGLGRRTTALAEERVEALLALVGMAALRDHYPHMLSGGEQQRVALARALAPQPRVLLMDEPFSGLDRRLRDSVREETVDLLHRLGTTVLVVTHDPEEAMGISDRIALLRQGRLVQLGSPDDLYDRPVNRETAAFFGEINVLHGFVKDRQAPTALGVFPALDFRDGTEVEVLLRPQAIHIDPAQGVPGRVARARRVGDDCLVDVELDATAMSGVPKPLMVQALVSYRSRPAVGSVVGLSATSGRALVFACTRPGAITQLGSQPGASTPVQTAV